MTVTTMAPAALVAPPARVPGQHGLISATVWRDNSPDRWETGIEWVDIGCGPIDGRGPDCVDPPVGLPKDLSGPPTHGEASPFTLYAPYQCSPVGFSLEEAQGYATARLLAHEEYRLEQAVWTGDLGNEPNFQSATVGTGGATSPHAVLAAMSKFVRQHYGTTGVLHVGPDGATVLKAEHLISLQSGRWVTMFGDRVAIGMGYPEHQGGPTLGPAAGGFAWAVMTPPVMGYWSEVFTSSGRPGDLVDRGTNDVHAIAERSYLVGWDHDCGHAVAYQMALVASVDGGGA